MRTSINYEVTRDMFDNIESRDTVIYVKGNKSDLEDDVFAYASLLCDYLNHFTNCKACTEYVGEKELMVCTTTNDKDDYREIKDAYTDFKKGDRLQVVEVETVEKQTTTEFANGDIITTNTIILGKTVQCEVIDANYSEEAIEVVVLENNVNTVLSKCYIDQLKVKSLNLDFEGDDSIFGMSYDGLSKSEVREIESYEIWMEKESEKEEKLLNDTIEDLTRKHEHEKLTAFLKNQNPNLLNEKSKKLLVKNNICTHCFSDDIAFDPVTKKDYCGDCDKFVEYEV